MVISAFSAKLVDPNLESLVLTLHCPIEITPLTKAVTLYPCMHKINENVAVMLYGSMTEEFCSKLSQPCPLCKQIVKEYKVDKTMRELASKILSYIDLEEMKLKIPEEFLKKAKNKANKTDTSKSSEFVHHRGKWSWYDSEEGIYWTI